MDKTVFPTFKDFPIFQWLAWTAAYTKLASEQKRLFDWVRAHPGLVGASAATPALLAGVYSVYRRNPELFERSNRLKQLPPVSKTEIRRTMQALEALRTNENRGNEQSPIRPRAARGKRAASGRQSR